ncbi:MAG: deoxyribose-phosphate aldolase [Prevotellaceae bacterium]|nr:deoxyribose-phosphate aldolase [Prevotellaceae bacterium]MDD7106972.1 deoxyribose-phosphate aldolase [Prevotellaceae bacterium]MDY3295835.1 deoxyribose-phosphate aldolase [Bacteroidaceae bacterium]
MKLQRIDDGKMTSKYDTALNLYNTRLKDEDAEKAVKAILEKVSENNTNDVKRFLFSTIEITSLTVTDNEDSILALTEKINDFTEENPTFPHPAAICVYPRFAKIVSESLEADGVEITCVAGGFPSSQTFPEVKTIETSLALKDGATEIDIVLPVGFFLAGDYEQVCDEIEEAKAIVGEESNLKVILETGALKTAENIKKAAILSMYSGADFIKTSTGKIEVSATPMAVYVMCQAIKEYFDTTGRKVGIKIAGGVRTTEQAVAYYTIVKEVLGKEWLYTEFFRIGASSLANNILTDLTGKTVHLF